jgi:hypothetical protein
LVAFFIELDLPLHHAISLSPVLRYLNRYLVVGPRYVPGRFP